MRIFKNFVFLLLAAVPTAASGESLSLTTALQRAAQTNVDLARERVLKKAAELDVSVAKNDFVPTISVDVNYNDDSRLIQDGRARVLNANASLAWRTQIGTRLALTARSSYVESGPDRVPLTEIEALIVQPLLSGGWGSDNDLAALDLSAKIQRELFTDTLNQILGRVERTYWSLVLAQSDVEISKRSVERARQQFEDTKQNIDQGILAPGDIYVVEENLVFFEQQLLRAEEALENQQLEIARLLNKPGTTFVATEDPLDYIIQLPIEPPVDDHPSVVAQRLIAQQADIRLDDARLNRLPSLDLTGGIALNGVNSPTSEAWGESLSAEFPDFRIGLLFSTPLWYASQNAVVTDRELDVQRAQLDYENATLAQTEQRASLRQQLDKRRKIFALAKRRVDLNKKKLETEVEKYKAGVSRLPEVVRFQRDLDSAELAVISARIAAILAASDLSVAMARRHEQAGVSVE